MTDFLSDCRSSMKEVAADPAVLVRVGGPLGPNGVDLFIGNRFAAEDRALLSAHDITCTMNVAVNVQIGPLMLDDGTSVRRTHVGLIDGPGNTPTHLLAAVFALHGILGQASPGRPSYPPHRSGNVLVHCRAGHSRSVAVLALYLHLVERTHYPLLEDAIGHISKLRNLKPHQPQLAMLELARKALEAPAIGMLSET